MMAMMMTKITTWLMMIHMAMRTVGFRSLRWVLQRPLFLSSTYVEMYHTSTILFGSTKSTLFAALNAIPGTMVVSDFGPYHPRLVHSDTHTERAGVIPTPWVMLLTLGFGAILPEGKYHMPPPPPRKNSL
jgi:hypothetical protein